MKACDYVVIGGGIVGFSADSHLGESYPGTRVLHLEEEGQQRGCMSISVVAGDIPDYAIAAGSPARVIKYRTGAPAGGGPAGRTTGADDH